MKMAGIYLHIPFCKRVCAYCDFYKSARTTLLDPVVEQMHGELEARAAYLGEGTAIETLYFGGGTPSLCHVEQLSALIERVKRLFNCSRLGEVTLEANPDDLSEEYLNGLRKVGINRLSIGVQSFDEEELRWMNRRHTARQAEEAVKAARRAGFDNITIDLIFGVPGFGREVLARSIDRALELEVEHISAYHLTIEPRTALGRKAEQGELQAVAENISEEEYQMVHQRLSQAGYEHYEISNFARPGRRARHNAAYWQGIPYLGIGPGAHSFNGESRCWCTDRVESYAEAGASRFEEEWLTPENRMNEYLMTHLRTIEGISLGEVERHFGTKRAQEVERLSERLLRNGSIVREGDRIRIPSEGFLLSDWIIGELMVGE